MHEFVNSFSRLKFFTFEQCCSQKTEVCVFYILILSPVLSSVAEPHYFYAAPAPGENFDAAPAAADPAPTLLYSKAKFLKRT
jgi:hypothetical protein